MSLATLRYEHVGKKAAESKQGAPIYDGLPSGFFEWEFRAMTRYHSTDDSEKWKLASKLTEGLTGESLKIAMSLGITELTKQDGVLLLIRALRQHIFPLASAEARELFKAGQRPGILSKQAGETMISYVSRRRRWYDLLRNLDKNVELSEQMRGELLLDHSGLSQPERLMVMTSTFNNLEFDRVAEALVKQHALAHSLKPATSSEKPHYSKWRKSYLGVDQEWEWPENEWPEAFFTAEHEADEEDAWQQDELCAWYTEEAYPWDTTWGEEEWPETAWYGESPWYEGSNQPADVYEAMVDHVDLEGDAEMAAMKMQSTYLSNEWSEDWSQAYFGKGKGKAKGRGKSKGKSKGKGKGYGNGYPQYRKGKGKSKGKGFARPGDLSLEDRRKKLQELKARTKCQACGQLGHWAGDN